MSFSATIYNCADDPRTLNKNLGSGITVSSITPTEACDILNPTFILNYNNSYATCNYIVVGAPFNRSYFITDMKIDIGKKITISCAVDVLGTYSNGIKGLIVNVIRQENLKEPYLPDPEYKMYSDFAPYTYLPDSGIDNNIYYHGADSKQYVISYVGGPRRSGGDN